MSVNYYSLLEITENASIQDIRKAYRRQALRYHPQNTGENAGDTYDKFTWVSEAYEVLSNPMLRSRYDQYGESGLKQGIPFDLREPKRFVYHGDPLRTFQEFFGGSNPFREIQEQMNREHAANFGREGGPGQPEEEPSGQEADLYLTLEEIYNGCTKLEVLEIITTNEECGTPSIQPVQAAVRLRPGLEEGTRLTFRELGIEVPNSAAGNLVFVIKAKEHPYFRRKGIDLYHTERISVIQALLGCTVEIPTLDKRLIRVAITRVIKPGFVQIIKGEGMPSPDDEYEMGDLYIEFDIVFPDTITLRQRKLLEAAFYRDGKVLDVLT